MPVGYNADLYGETADGIQTKTQVEVGTPVFATTTTVNFRTPNGDIVKTITVTGEPESKHDVTTEVPDGYPLLGDPTFTNGDENQTVDVPVGYNADLYGETADGIQVWTKTETGTPISTPGRDETPTPGGDETPTPGGDETPTPGGDETPTPGGDETPTPGSDETPTPGSDETPTPGGDETPTPGGDETPTPGSDETPTPTSTTPVTENGQTTTPTATTPSETATATEQTTSVAPAANFGTADDGDADQDKPVERSTAKSEAETEATLVPVENLVTDKATVDNDSATVPTQSTKSAMVTNLETKPESRVSSPDGGLNGSKRYRGLFNDPERNQLKQSTETDVETTIATNIANNSTKNTRGGLFGN